MLLVFGEKILPVKFTEDEYKRLQARVNKKRPPGKISTDSPGLYDRVDRLERKVRELETRIDYIMVRFLKKGG